MRVPKIITLAAVMGRGHAFGQAPPAAGVHAHASAHAFDCSPGPCWASAGG